VNRGLSFAIAALQALIIVATAIGIIVAPLTLAWFIEGDGSVEWIVTLRVAVYAFLLSLGVSVEISAGELAGIEFPSFVMAAMPLGMTAVMALMTIRIGYRLSAASSLWPAWVGGGIAFGGISYGAALLVSHESVMVDEFQPLWVPALFFAGLLFISSTAGKRFELFPGANGPEAKERVAVRAFAVKLYESLHWSLRSALSPAVRVGLGVVATMIFTSSMVIMLALSFGWIEVIRLYEELGLSVLGGAMLTLGQLAILPNLIIYATAWISGIGFAIGTGSLVSPLATQLGPIPALPVFAAIPTGGFDRGILFALVPIIAAFVGTILVRRYTDQMRWEYGTRYSAAFSLALVAAITAALTSFVMAALASGSFGPGRFQEVGINPLLFAAVIFLQVLIPSFIAGLVVAKPYVDENQRR
jgi:hypothetical protein